ncbi:peptidoglycan-binding protein LysM [Flavobacterium aquariorum]|uniref:peptidoglycan-binding protein LysM n=1 Tax=Flavobacterium aquariorum TaxID=2217670 RepID=UPI001A9D2F7E|nr:peptidoglycan-binding protein LysM [Flavobacterium aquariorum]
MRTKERTYTIKTGDTLHKVAQELAIPPMELRRHHNIYCEIPDLIEADFPSHLELLLLPSDKSEVTANSSTGGKTRKVGFVNGSTLPFLPSGSKKNYDVLYVLEDGDEKDTIHFETSVKWMAVDPKGFHFFEIDRLSKTYINDTEPDTMMEELAAKTAEILYPLQIVVDLTGKWIDIHNYNQILERWENKKNEIVDYYEGEVAQIYIEHTEQSLTSKAALNDSLRSDLFLRALFNGIHIDYTTNHTFENNITFPLIKDEQASFLVQQKVTPFLEDRKWIKIEQKGDYLDTDFDIDFEFDPWKGNYNATYFLNPNSYCVEKMELECVIHYDSPIKATINIEEIKPEEVVDTNNENSTNTGGMPKKESFFSLLTGVFNETQN